MSRAAILGVFALAGCGGFGGSLSIAEPGLREEGGAEDDAAGEERDGDEAEVAGVEACADLLVRCIELGVSDDTALQAFDECLGANVRDDEGDGDEERDGERDGDEERDGDTGSDADPERPA